MSPATSQRLETVLEAIIPQLEAKGFAVFLQPSQDMLPSFLDGIHPDAVAFKPGRKIAIEVVLGHPGAERKAQRMREAFDGHPEWELRLVYAPPSNKIADMPTLSFAAIEQQLHRIENAFDEMGAPAALLIGWAAFEAAARYSVPASFARPQTSMALLEQLASLGCVTPDEADRLRDLSLIRNGVAHGGFDLEVGREAIVDLVGMTRNLLELGTAERSPEPV